MNARHPVLTASRAAKKSEARAMTEEESSRGSLEAKAEPRGKSGSADFLCL